MGRATEYLNYLKTDPSNLTGFKKEMCYLEITEGMEKQRKELKLYQL